MFIKLEIPFHCPKCDYKETLVGTYADNRTILPEKKHCPNCNWFEGMKEKCSFAKTEKKIIATRDRIYWNIVILDLITKRKKYFQYREKDLSILADLKNRAEKEHFKVLKDFVTKGKEIIKEEIVYK
jgi:hypothetical protein